MLLPGTINPKIWLIFTVLIAFIVLGETSDDHRLDIKFGFDLRQGDNGAPSLRIREFEGSSNVNRRADDDSTEGVLKPKVKPSSSDSDSDEPSKKESSKEKGKSHNSEESDSESNDNDDSTADRIRSTRGLKAEDFEPEEESHKPKYNKAHHSGDDSEGSSRRRRSIGALNIMKVKKFIH